MNNLKGTTTEKNILKAFAGESQARNRYDYFSSVAKKEGYVQIAWIFEETAKQEKEHAKRFFKLLEGGETEIIASFPSGVIGKTIDNLKSCIAGENYEHTVMYPKFAKIASNEGFGNIATIFNSIAKAEKQHEKRFLALASNLESNSVFKKSSKVTWRCLNCGYVISNENAPNICPACDHPKDYFEILAENW